MSAYACDPAAGSEGAVGWDFVRAISANHEAWVVTAEFNELRLRAHPIPNVRFLYVRHRPWHYRPSPRWKQIESSAFKPLMNLAYEAWLRDAFDLGRRLHAQYQFDLLHQLTYVGFRFPGYLWELPIPFVWGPIGGAENTAWKLLPLMGLEGTVYYGARNLINSAQLRWLPAPRHATRRPKVALISATSGVREVLRRSLGADSEVICEITRPELDVVPQPSLRDSDEPLRLSWSGQHLAGKALPILLKALALLPPPLPWRLDVLGDGPLTGEWKATAEKLGIGDRCTWHGWVARKAAMALVGRSHVFVITSLKDLTSTVLVEALTMGTPVIALDHCGFRDAITSECGVLVPTEPVRSLSHRMAIAIERIAGDESFRRELSRGGLARASFFSREHKARAVDEIYQRLAHE